MGRVGMTAVLAPANQMRSRETFQATFREQPVDIGLAFVRHLPKCSRSMGIPDRLAEPAALIDPGAHFRDQLIGIHGAPTINVD